MAEYTVHYTDLLLRENMRLMLVFPGRGFIPFRIDRSEMYRYEYDRLLAEAQEEDLVPSATELRENAYLNPFVLQNASADDILEIEEEDHLYQVFWSPSPSALRVYKQGPVSIFRGAVDVEAMVPRALYGYYDGYLSPWGNPSIQTEIWMPHGKNEIAFGFWNPLTYTMWNPLLEFRGVQYTIKVITSVSLIRGMILGREPARKATVGGLAEIDYNTKKPYDIDPIPLDANTTEIHKALGKEVEA